MRDKTRPSRVPSLPAKVKLAVLKKTATATPADATHWSRSTMATRRRCAKTRTMSERWNAMRGLTAETEPPAPTACGPAGGRGAEQQRIAVRSSLHHLSACLVIVAIGFALRVYGMGAIDLWGDEAFSWWQSNRSLPDLLAATARDNYPPLHNIILHGAISLFGDTVYALRAPSVLMGTLTIYIVYVAGNKMWDWRTGLVAALLLAFSPLHIWHSIEARMYALFCLASLVYVLASFAFLTSGSLRSMMACIVSGVALLYSHVFGSFVFVAVNAAVLMNALGKFAPVKPGLAGWTLAQATAYFAFLPWLVILLNRASTATQLANLGMTWIPAPTPTHLAEVALQLLGGPFVIAIGLAAIAGLRGGHAGASASPGHSAVAEGMPENHRLALLLCAFCVTVPPLIAYIISLTVTPFVLSRYLISTLPVVFLLFGRFTSRTISDPRTLIAILAVMLLGVAAILPRIAASGWIKPLRTDLASFERLRADGDRVLYLGWDWPLFYYYVRDRAGLDLRVARAIPADDGKARRMWLVNLNGTEGRDMADGLKTSGWRETYHAATPLILFSLFER